jgi:hypothetical protein
MNEERKNGGDGNGDIGGNGDPQFTTPGVGEQLDETAAEAGGPIPGPMEGQGGEPEAAEPEPARPQRKAAPRKKAKSAGSRAKKGSKAKPAARGRSAAGKKKAKSKGKGKAKARSSAKRGKKGGSPKATRRKKRR